MGPAERYKNDPVFHQLVHSFYAMFEDYCGSGAGITPSEIREASGYAWQRYIERHPFPILVEYLPPENKEADRWP